jgi:hypothetical protein
MRDLTHTYRFVFDREITEGRVPQEEASGSELPPGALFPQYIMTFLAKTRFRGILMKSALRRINPLPDQAVNLWQNGSRY